jgi:hypothetical protein
VTIRVPSRAASRAPGVGRLGSTRIVGRLVAAAGGHECQEG